MKVGFLLWDIANITGGAQVIIEHALGLQRRGHHPLLITVREAPREAPAWHPGLPQLAIRPLSAAISESFDFVFATWWYTYFDLWRLESKVYAYLNQSIESRFHSELHLKALNRITYSLPLVFVTQAKWIEQFIRLMQPSASVQRIPNGLNPEFFPCVAEPPAHGPPLRVLVEGPWGIPFKRVAESFELLDELAKEVPMEVGWLTSHSGGLRPKLGSHSVQVFERVSLPKVHTVLRQYDVLLKLSSVEGVFGPPLEIFSQGGTAITRVVTGCDEYMIHGHNSLLAEPGSRTKLFHYFKLLSQSPSYLSRLRVQALETARSHPTWETSSLQFVQFLEALHGGRFSNAHFRPALHSIAMMAGDYLSLFEATMRGETAAANGRVNQVLMKMFKIIPDWLARTLTRVQKPHHYA